MTTNRRVQHETRAERVARFERNVMPFLDYIYTAAVYLTGDPDTAEDLVTDCFTRASHMTIEESTNVKRWLYRLLIDTHGNAKRERTSCEPAEHMIDPTDTHTSPLQATAAAKALARIPETRVKQALQQVSLSCRVVVYFVDVEGYTYRQIADMINAPIGSVAARLHRERRQLRALLLRHPPAAQPNMPEESVHDTTDLVDKAIRRRARSAQAGIPIGRSE